MRNLYYRIWVDTIINVSKNPERKQDWKSMTMVLMTMMISLNVMTVLMWFGNLTGYKVNWIKIESLPGTMLDSFASFVIQFGLPCFLLNYFLIFYKGRYKKLINKYPDRKGKLGMGYMFRACLNFKIGKRAEVENEQKSGSVA